MELNCQHATPALYDALSAFLLGLSSACVRPRAISIGVPKNLVS
jgi:hypothetical protein